MKITALTNNNVINQQLANYALSLFEQTKTEVVDVTRETIDQIYAKVESSVLIVLVINENALTTKILNDEILLKKPILLLTTFKNQTLLNTIHQKLNRINTEVWGEFNLENNNKTFNAKHEIEDVSQRLQLIRLVNKTMFTRLGIKDKNRFTCGISRPKHYVGDAIGY